MSRLELLISYNHKKYSNEPLAGVVQWTECRPVNRKVASSIPSQGTCPGCRPGPQWGRHKRRVNVSSPSLSPSPPFSLKINKIFKKLIYSNESVVQAHTKLQLPAQRKASIAV